MMKVIEAANDLLKLYKTVYTHRQIKHLLTAAPGRKFVSLHNSAVISLKALLPGANKRGRNAPKNNLVPFVDGIDSLVDRERDSGKNLHRWNSCQVYRPTASNCTFSMRR